MHVGRTRPVEPLGHRLPKPPVPRDAIVDRGVQQTACLVRHPESPGTERFVDFLRCRAGERQLEVVNDRRAVGRERRHETALHQINQDRAEAGFDDVRADAPQDDAVAGARRHDRIDHRREIGAREDPGQRLHPAPHPAARHGASQIGRVRLAPARREGIGPDAGEIEFFVGEFHGSNYRSTPNGWTVGSLGVGDAQTMTIASP